MGKQKRQLRLSAESPVDNPALTIHSFIKQFQLNKQEKEAVELGWMQEYGGTMLNIVNAYTRARQLEGLSAESSYRLQKVGGNILGMLK